MEGPQKGAGRKGGRLEKGAGRKGGRKGESWEKGDLKPKTDQRGAVVCLHARMLALGQSRQESM